MGDRVSVGTGAAMMSDQITAEFGEPNQPFGPSGSIHEQPWPDYDEALTRDDVATIVIQVNGRVRERLESHELDALADYRARSPHGARAHPSDEHFLPLFVALGAAREDYKPERIYSAIDSGVLSMDAYVFN